MLGKPKYKHGTKVTFTFDDGVKKVGVVEIVDRYGTFLYRDDVSYDIFCEDENILYKHIPEKFVKRKIVRRKKDVDF